MFIVSCKLSDIWKFEMSKIIVKMNKFNFLRVLMCDTYRNPLSYYVPHAGFLSPCFSFTIQSENTKELKIKTAFFPPIIVYYDMTMLVMIKKNHNRQILQKLLKMQYPIASPPPPPHWV